MIIHDEHGNVMTNAQLRDEHGTHAARFLSAVVHSQWYTPEQLRGTAELAREHAIYAAHYAHKTTRRLRDDS
jgi:hypothetical protein